MSRAIVIKLQAGSATVVVARPSNDRVLIESAAVVGWAPTDDLQARAQKLAEVATRLNASKLIAVAVAPRSCLWWQNYDLPPAPAEDLPELVHLQAQRDLALADDGLGFDFLPLAGDAERPHRVLAVGMPPAELEQIRQLLAAAQLRLEHVTPEPLGWPALAMRSPVLAETTSHGMAVCVAVAGKQATIWATQGSALRMLRTILVPEADDVAKDSNNLVGEMRRSLLALSQGHGAVSLSELHCIYIGQNSSNVADQLAVSLGRPVRGVEISALVELRGATGEAGGAVELAPLAALAAQVAEKATPLVDLINPRRRPAPKSRRRTIALAGASAALLAILAAWAGYRNVQAPVEAAEGARAEAAALAPQLEVLAEDEIKAAAIRQWTEGSENLLTDLDDVGQQLRPQALASDDYPVDQDILVTKFVLADRKMTITAAAKKIEALQPVENRLRAAGYRVARGPVEASANPAPEYPVSVTAIVEKAQAAPGGAPGAAP